MPPTGIHGLADLDPAWPFGNAEAGDAADADSSANGCQAVEWRAVRSVAIACATAPVAVPSNVVPAGFKDAIVHIDPLLRSLAADARTEFISLVESYVGVLRRTSRQSRRREP